MRSVSGRSRRLSRRRRVSSVGTKNIQDSTRQALGVGWIVIQPAPQEHTAEHNECGERVMDKPLCSLQAAALPLLLSLLYQSLFSVWAVLKLMNPRMTQAIVVGNLVPQGTFYLLG